jgi:murein DD-endopeptidase MepM/ murein hydrolase activator NlpD
MGLLLRTISGVFLLALACVGAADAGRSAGGGAEPGISDLKRAIARAERTAAAAAQSRAEAESAIAEAQTRLADVDSRAAIGLARATELQAAANAAETVAARALASLSLAARGAGPAPHPALAGLAGRLGAGAEIARVEADQARSTALVIDVERRDVLVALGQASVELEAADAAFRTADVRLSTLRSYLKVAERVESERRLADQRAPKKRDELRLAAARSSAERNLAVPAAHNAARLDWSSPIRGGSARVGAAGGALTIAARPGADVFAPIEGEITYAGLFRTYGQVLILSGSDGYAFVLSGMDRNFGTTGQFVRRGERIGALAAREPAELGLELRRNGTPIAADRWAKDEIKPRKGESVGRRRMTDSLD